MTLKFKTLALTASLAIAASLPAAADTKTEAYVLKNANAALMTLNDPKLDADQRTEAFQGLMNKFTDIDRVSRFVLGVYSRRFSSADMAKYQAAYREYALAVYEAQLDQYRGQEIVVTGSVDRSDSDSIVESVVKRASGDLPVKWRVMKVDGKAGSPDTYQVVDVALNLDGNLLWLGIEQRAQFVSILDRSNGSANALITKIDEMTKQLRAESAANLTMVDNLSNAG